MLLPTSLVGSYPQPDWLIDRDKLSKQVPRVRMHDLWLDRCRTHLEAAQDDATLARDPRSGTRRARHRQRRRAAPRKLFQPLRDRARRRRYRQSRHHHQSQRQDHSGAAHHRQDPAAASGRSARRRASARQHRPQDQGDGARALHHGAAGAGRFLSRRGSARDGLRGRRSMPRSRICSPPAPTSCRSTSPGCSSIPTRRGDTA